MKLLHYTTHKLAILLLLLIGIWGVVFYFAIHHEIMDETDDMLRSYRDIFIKKALADSTLLDSTSETLFDRYAITPVDRAQAFDYQESWSNEEIYFPEGDEHIPVRVYKSVFRVPGDRFYELEVKISTVERDDMIQTLVIYLIGLVLLLFLCLFLGNRIVLKRSFKPLKKLLHWIHSLVPGKPVPPLDNETGITEFRQLNEAVLRMSRRNLEVYEQQKYFIENAAHELQTPLAVVRNRLDQFVQNERLDEKQMEELSRIHEALENAVRLNKSLLLLSRIENGQFPDTENVDIGKLIADIGDEMAEIYAGKEIRMEIEEREPCRPTMNNTLALILVTNLMKNAYLHTPPGGIIGVVIQKHGILVINSGDHALPQENLFQRFYRLSGSQQNSTGLGLSIIKSICDHYNFHIFYEYSDRCHRFGIEFS